VLLRSSERLGLTGPSPTVTRKLSVSLCVFVAPLHEFDFQ
jgi:hypothetical protein